MDFHREEIVSGMLSNEGILLPRKIIAIRKSLRFQGLESNQYLSLCDNFKSDFSVTE